jgi:hypothetical protein
MLVTVFVATSVTFAPADGSGPSRATRAAHVLTSHHAPIAPAGSR